ncbi:MAG TPA: 3-deoxy-D-manno-octulosonic acid transferase [Pseudolabrys sp.]|nr:3-deoxy-D-manno-octulosonic acid transferase [Pseudolabrys sp.]
MPERLPATLTAYSLLSTALTPLAPLWLRRRLKRGKEHAARIGERRGFTHMARPRGPLVWIHGASVGELTTVFPLIDRIHGQGFNVLVTSGTLTSAQIAQQRLPKGVIHQFVPLDAPRFVRRFLDHWQPDLTLFTESDLWPNLILQSAGRHVPLILINGRLSPGSFQRWTYLQGTIGGLLRRFDLCLARTPADAQRFGDLGAPRVVTAGDIKLDVPAPQANPDKLQLARQAFAGRPVIAAASTHPGEEAAIIEAHKELARRFPDLLTVVAPRHPERGPGIAEIASVARLSSALRSRGELPSNSTAIYIADTIGELGIIYRLAPIVFIGGSLVTHGGQNPIEPAKLGAAILHGPHVHNFAELYAALDSAHGAEQVSDAGTLTARMGAWLSDPTARKRVADSARTTVESLGGALERTVAALEPYLLQLRLEYRSNHA